MSLERWIGPGSAPTDRSHLRVTFLAGGLMCILAMQACSSAPSPPAAAGTGATVSQPAARDEKMEQFVESVLAKLTLEEKLGQLAQYRGQGTPTGPQVPEGGEAEIRAGRVGSFLGVHGAAYTREMQGIAVEQSRARIPLLFAEDVIHGF